MGCDIVDSPLEASLSVDLVEGGTNGLSTTPVAATGVRDQEKDTFYHPVSKKLAATDSR
jgi:hypothetical protein